MDALFLGIDTGTQGVRIGISDAKGNILTTHEKKWETIYPKMGWVEQEPSIWWNYILDTMEKCCEDLTEEQKQSIVSCCVCSTSSTVLAIDREGNPIMNAMMWMDARSAKEMKEINDTKHPVLEYCGGETSFEWFVPKVLWLKNNERELYDSCYKIVEQLDWINFKLCGKLFASMCNATCKWNYVKSLGGFQKDFFEEIGLEDYEDKILTDVKEIGEELGVIRSELANRFGFNENMKVVQGGIDAHMAMFGLDVVEPNKLGIIMGTSFVHLCLSEERTQINGIWGPYDSAVIDELWLLEGGQISASGLVNWFRENFHIDDGDDNPYARLMKAAESVPIGSEGITVLDFFQGNRTPYKNPSAKGVIYGLGIEHNWKHIYRALIESVSFGTYNIIRNFEKQNYRIDSITACGGVTQDHVWMQIIADITGKKIIVPKQKQAGVQGCCVAAAAGGRYYQDFQESASAMVKPAFVVEPDMENHEKYREPFEKYIKLYESLKSLMDQ